MASFTWVLATLLYMFLDVAYFLRGISQAFVSKMMLLIQGRKNILDAYHNHGICLTTDMDFQWHMNNARYLRECDFGRIDMWIRNGIYEAVAKMGGGITMGSSTVRYRKSLQLFDTYFIKTKILCWDEKAFYVEQRIIRRQDNFVCMILLARQALMKVSPGQALREIYGEEQASPPMPEEVKVWNNYNLLSSEKLKTM